MYLGQYESDSVMIILGISHLSPAVNHIDNTTRPQTLDRQYNGEFYDVVKGMNGIVLNTSLNLAGDPINSMPEDAIMSFRYSGMDAMILGDYLIKR
jgi:carbamoyltransferase